MGQHERVVRQPTGPVPPRGTPPPGSTAQGGSSPDGFAPGARVDLLTGDPVRIVPSRQGRPNLPDGSCPFCPGGVEAPHAYDVLAFPNRWPPFPDGRAEVVLYTSRHEGCFGALDDAEAAAVVRLWAARSAELGARPDVAYVLVFENRGPEVGATISHPHGQIYAFPDVPPAVLDELRAPGQDDALAPEAAGDRLVDRAGGWRCWVPAAARWPFELLLAPDRPIADLPSLDDDEAADLGALLARTVRRLDALFDQPMPYMMWIHQRPFDGIRRHQVRVHLHLAPALRSPGTQRFVAAGELGSGVWFNPVEPGAAAAQLRAAGS